MNVLTWYWVFEEKLLVPLHRLWCISVNGLYCTEQLFLCVWTVRVLSKKGYLLNCVECFLSISRYDPLLFLLVLIHWFAYVKLCFVKRILRCRFIWFVNVLLRSSPLMEGNIGLCFSCISVCLRSQCDVLAL